MEWLDICDLKFANVDMKGVVDEIGRIVSTESRGNQIVTVNTDILLKSKRDPELNDIIRNSWIVTADGMPIVWLSSLMGGRRLRERVTGSDLAIELCTHSAALGLKLFFLGANPGVAEKAKARVAKDWPDAQVVGTYSPSPYELVDPVESEKIVRLMNNSSANVIFAAFGAPKQEKWLFRYKEHLDAAVLVGVGASLDFLAGSLPRAPKWMQDVGLEWLFRLVSEPRRLWKRYLSDMAILPLFIQAALSRVGWKRT